MRLLFRPIGIRRRKCLSLKFGINKFFSFCKAKVCVKMLALSVLYNSYRQHELTLTLKLLTRM